MTLTSPILGAAGQGFAVQVGTFIFLNEVLMFSVLAIDHGHRGTIQYPTRNVPYRTIARFECISIDIRKPNPCITLILYTG